VLEIGCGWGGLAMRLVQGGACVTAITLSPAQRDYAAAMIETAGLTTQIDLRLEDYRQVAGRYDRIVSIEMLEAVGEAHWPVYFERLHSLLKPGGTAVLQVITIADDRFGAYRHQPDFIQRHVFPGGMLPCPSALRTQIVRAGFVLEKVETFGDSYARTLQEWRARFLAARLEVVSLGFTTRFRRLWDYYLAYCEAGFRTGVVDVALWQLRA
jgi:cyclopropane-fatty-acyl-phospholipid synthase